MTTQVSFITDNDLKNKALEKAKSEGISLKTLLVYSMKAYVEGKISLGIKIADEESDLEEMVFDDEHLNEKALKLAKLLKRIKFLD